ncbi:MULTISPECIES: phosphate acyltransferase PlsX [Halomonadaceae]|uniref:phosphate acyltransferase PlsX n=1 Tax=Halomonadaceae TaxID=28256 RepID=UPI0015837D13|nr:phosphate acyltransferase PlsX [Halomonas sp. BMC7]MDI4637657.1 phosphate acyltransferase PlsX [Halomonas sp. BMC7]NUJ58676.1 phosphate acyltransferase PlsX [Halomonas taeanensis]
MRIAIDAMGGDFGPRATVSAAVRALQAHPRLQLSLFGQQPALDEALAHLVRCDASSLSRLTLHHSPAVVAEDAKPSSVLRGSKDSSLSMMLDCVASGEAQAAVSAGNTGALMALARRALGTVAGIPRPAISTAVPTRGKGHCYLLDLGANVEADAERLVDFALMGEVMARRIDGLRRPRVALLNVGIEGTKGTASVREADARLRDFTHLDYRGFIEGDGIYSGLVDVVVCDGFVGNAVLKASEGLARMLIQRVQQTFEAHWGSRLVGLLARPALRRLRGELDPVRYNGASLLGLDGIVVKSHGSADAIGFAHAISRAIQEVREDLPSQLAHELGERRPVIASAACGRGDSGMDARCQTNE